MSVLVIAEHDNKALKPATRNTVSAAGRFNEDIHLLVIGWQCDAAAAQAAAIAGVTEVITVQAGHYQHLLAEELAAAAASIAGNYTAVLAPATTFGKNLLPRLGALLDMQPVSDVIAIESADTFKRPIYAGNVIATVQSTDSIKLLTIRATAFDEAPQGESPVGIRTIEPQPALGLSQFKREELANSDRPDLTSARVVVSGGRALGSAENFDMLYALADKLGGAVGASRAAVDAGYVPNDLQVGQTGKIVAPDLYIAVGISGAIQHLAGMQGSKVVVAINKDADSPIFQVADYSLTADLFEAVPELTSKL